VSAVCSAARPVGEWAANGSEDVTLTTPDHGGLLDTELHGDRVRGLETDAANIPS
jgi:hypothetical protein